MIRSSDTERAVVVDHETLFFDEEVVRLDNRDQTVADVEERRDEEQDRGEHHDACSACW
jgi:hypothetical protein